MGYTTEFEGRFEFNRPLTVPEFNDIKSVYDDDKKLPAAPNSYCQWVPSVDGLGLEWTGGEKFYYYVEWLTWLIENKLKPLMLVLNGTVTWQGEDIGDSGTITVTDNDVQAVKTADIIAEAQSETADLRKLIELQDQLLDCYLYSHPPGRWLQEIEPLRQKLAID